MPLGRGLTYVDDAMDFHQFVAESEQLIESGDQRVFYKHLKGTVDLQGTRAKEEQFIRDEVWCTAAE